MSILENVLQAKDNKKMVFTIGIIVSLLIATGVWYFMFYKTSNIVYEEEHTIGYESNSYAQDESNVNVQNDSLHDMSISENNEQNGAGNLENQDSEHIVNNDSDVNSTQNTTILDNHLSTELASNTSNDSFTMQDTMISQLKYSIKPLDTIVASCNTMRNGKWNMVNSCQNNMISSIHKLIDTNKEVVALEVSGIVDSNPYAGPSAELKQEGLASFRAREAIKAITLEFSNIAVFEGLSMQIPNKRGFEVKAYYLQR